MESQAAPGDSRTVGLRLVALPPPVMAWSSSQGRDWLATVPLGSRGRHQHRGTASFHVAFPMAVHLNRHQGRGSEFQRRDRLSLADVRTAVVVKPEGGLAVTENVSDRAVGLAGVSIAVAAKWRRSWSLSSEAPRAAAQRLLNASGRIGTDPSIPAGKTYSEPVRLDAVNSRRRTACRRNSLAAVEVSGTSRQSDPSSPCGRPPLRARRLRWQLRYVSQPRPSRRRPSEWRAARPYGPGAGKPDGRVRGLGISFGGCGQEFPYLGCRWGEGLGPHSAGPGRVLGWIRVDQSPLAGQFQSSGKHGGTRADPGRAVTARSHRRVERFDVAPSQPREPDVAKRPPSARPSSTCVWPRNGLVTTVAGANSISPVSTAWR